jgi:hypothetical protein
LIFFSPSLADEDSGSTNSATGLDMM